MKATEHLRKIAWYGIRCKIPVEFQPACIEKNHLIFEREGKPVFEVKWQKTNATANPRQIIKNLSRESSRFTLPPRLIEPDPALIPRQKTNIKQFYRRFYCDNFSMLNSLSPFFTPYPFNWETESTRAKGIVLLCCKCNGISILQFFEPIDDSDMAGQIVSGQPDINFPDDTAHDIVRSFCDHKEHPSDPLIWALFDMHAIIPFRYQLEKYSFQPGYFSMAFKYKNTILKLHRFSPASFILSKKNLQQFIEYRFGLSLKHFSTNQNFHKIKNAVEYTRKNNNSGKKTFFCFLNKMFKQKHLISLCRAWHLPDKNRILAVTFQSRGAVDSSEFNKICKNYKIV